MFGNTEHHVHHVQGIARANEARARISRWLRSGAEGLVLTGPAAVAWACGGVAPPVDRTAAVDLVWAVFAAGGSWLITTNVEADRIRSEYDPSAHGFDELAEVPWYTPSRFVDAAVDLAGIPARRLSSDGHPSFGRDATEDLIGMRLALSEPERDELASLGADAAHALQSSLTEWLPGETDLEIQARCAAHLEAAGADTPVLIVGGDDRLERYRHPMAIGVPVRRRAMAVAVVRRCGLHVALTRFAAAGPRDQDYDALRRRVRSIEDAVLAASIPQATYGAALEALAAGYAAAGADGEWKRHYQGGPIGFAQREFEIAPGQTGSRWYSQPIEAWHAIAWNPSLPGGAKAEDTYLVTPDGSVTLLSTAPGWPTDVSESGTSRPAVLEVDR